MARRPRKLRIVHVLCNDAAGYRWLKSTLLAAVAFETADGFEVRDESRWAEYLQAARGREVP